MATPTPTSTPTPQASATGQGEHFNDTDKAQAGLISNAFSASASVHQLDGYFVKLLQQPNRLYLQTFFPEGSTTEDLNRRVFTFIKKFQDTQEVLNLKSGEEYSAEFSKISASDEPLGTALFFDIIAKQMRLAIGDAGQLDFNLQKAQELDLEFESYQNTSIGRIARTVLTLECHKRIYHNKTVLLNQAFKAEIKRFQLSDIFCQLMQESSAFFFKTFFPEQPKEADLNQRVLNFLVELKGARQQLMGLNEQERSVQHDKISKANRPLGMALFLNSTAKRILNAIGDQTQLAVNRSDIATLEGEFKSYGNSDLGQMLIKVLHEASETRMTQIRLNSEGGSSQGGGAAARPLRKGALKLSDSKNPGGSEKKPLGEAALTFTPSKHQIDAEAKSNELKRKREKEAGKRPLETTSSDQIDNAGQASAGPDLSRSKRRKVDERLPSEAHVARHTNNQRSLRTQLLACQSFNEYCAG